MTTPSPPRRSPLTRIARLLFAVLSVAAILLAVGLGVFRLLVAQIPEYQSEIKARVADELGLVVDFAALDARLGLTGPELSLRDASIGGGNDGGFLQAEQATITLDPFALILRRRIEISRLTLSGLSLTVERDADGIYRLGDHALESGDGKLADRLPQSVELVIRNSTLHVVDTGSDRSWDFDDLDLAMESADGKLRGSASLKPPAALADPIEVDFDAELPDAEGGPSRWRINAGIAGLDLAQLGEFLPVPELPEIDGRGQLAAEAEWADGRLASVKLGADFENLTIGEPGAGGPPFERLSFTADWERAGTHDFRLALSDINLRRGGRSWVPSGTAEFALERDDSGIHSVHLTTDFVRLDDLEPIVKAVPDSQLAEQWRLFEPVGDLRDIDFSIERRADTVVYGADARFDGLSVRQVGSTPGIEDISGHVRANEDSGTIEFASGPLRVDWPSLFPQVVAVDSLSGAVVWRQGRDVVQVLSVDLDIGVLGDDATASFDFKLPRDGGSPTLELDARLPAAELVPAKAYLPTRIMPDAVADWLERAVVGGDASNIELSFYGPLQSFPFDDGRGQFRVAADIAGATLNYMDGWPMARDLDGRIEFLDAGFSASGSGRALSNRTEHAVIDIPDMRRPELTLTAATRGPLVGVADYLGQSPLIAAHLGPDFERLEVRGGTGVLDVGLVLPLKDLPAYRLDASLAIADGEIAIDGLGPGFTEINGVMKATEAAVTADSVEAIFLGGPITASLAPSAEPGYRAEVAVAGETTAEAVAESFALPHEDLLAGQTRWQGRLWLPALDPLATTPTRIRIESNLTGVALRFPEPLAKRPSEPSNLAVELEFAADNALAVKGNLGASRRFELSFHSGDSGLEFARGAIRFGGGAPVLPIQPGILVDGQIEVLQLDDWLALSSQSTLSKAGPLFLGADVDVADLHAYGQRLGATSLRVQRGTSEWRIDVASEPIAGQIVVPRGDSDRAPIVADMSRVYLAAGEGGDLAGIDPKTLPGLTLRAGEFGVGTRRLGQVEAVLAPDPRGLVLSAFKSQTEHFSTELSGSWLQGPLGTRTTIDAHIASTDVESALGELGLAPVIAGEAADVKAAVYWDSAPGGDWLDHLNGEVHLSVDTGSLREIDPGAGRVVGLMSIAALPRRLALDFRDVFQEGFAFDEIGGDFKIIDGNAYTNNLRFGGPAAEIYVVGRTGLRDRDYRQQIVVTSEPGNMLPTVAGLLGGPGAGAALFVFTRLFKEPLKGIGRASYCLKGSWEAPEIDPIDKDAKAKAASCAELPDTMLATPEDD